MLYIPMPAGKVCIKCGKWLPANHRHFHRQAARADGLNSWCKDCMNAYNKGRRLLCPELFRERGRINSRKYRSKYPEQIHDRNVRYYAANSQYRREQGRRYRQENAERHRQAARSWALQNPERKKRNTQRWNEAHPEKGRLYARRRRARKKSLPDEFTEEDWAYAINYFGGCCAVCGRPQGLWRKLVADHWIPLSSLDCPGTVPENIVPLCHGADDCNQSKKNRSPHEWLARKFGKRKAAQILKRIEVYFESVRSRKEEGG